MTTANLQIDHHNWGPFSPYYLGAMRILNADAGSTLDLALHVARKSPAAAVIPDSIFAYRQNLATGERRTEIGAVPEDIAPDYSRFSIRYYLDRKGDGDTALAQFSVTKKGQLHCELTFNNRSNEDREYTYGLGAVVSDPTKRIRLKEALRPWWIAGHDYSEIESYQRTFGMGCKPCVSRAFEWGLEEGALAQAFGGWADDRVLYRKTLPKPVADGMLYFRYVKYGELRHPWEVRVNGNAVRFEFPQTQPLPGGAYGKNRDAYKEWRLVRVAVGAIETKEITVELRPIDPPGNDHARIWLDGIIVSDGHLHGDSGAEATLPTSVSDDWLDSGPKVQVARSEEHTIDLSIDLPGGAQHTARIDTGSQACQHQKGTDSLNAALRAEFNQPPEATERDARGNPWIRIDCSPVTVAAQSSASVSFSVAIDGEPIANPTAYSDERRTPDNGPYAEVAARLRDALLFDINYPLIHNGKPTPYVVPSKYFPLPYFWDGGIAGLGMAAFDPALAARQTAFYLADPDEDYPFFSCGSPVPTQFYALWEVYHQTQDVDFLKSIYPGAKRMYDFFLGRFPGSVVNLHGDGMLSTYAYNYNLGIDDHPIQMWAEENNLTHLGLYSIILMTQILRAARIMRNAAQMIGATSDVSQFSEDATLLADIIDNRMWDADSALYGWLYRNEAGDVQPLKMPDGCAGDRSACAFLPLFAGLIAHKDELIRQLEDPARFSTPFGISSVDRAAPTYNPNGYWNGAVWPVMQWFIWRGLIEAGEMERARSVATTILQTWQAEFDRAQYLGEHFVLKDEKISGAPNFAGLSAVLVPMHAAYFEPYHITTSYDAIITRKQIDEKTDRLSLTVTAPFLDTADYVLLVNMGAASGSYTVSINGTVFKSVKTDPFGHLAIQLPKPTQADTVVIERG